MKINELSDESANLSDSFCIGDFFLLNERYTNQCILDEKY